MAGLCYEEFSVGLRIEHPIRRTATEMDNIGYNQHDEIVCECTRAGLMLKRKDYEALMAKSKAASAASKAARAAAKAKELAKATKAKAAAKPAKAKASDKPSKPAKPSKATQAVKATKAPAKARKAAAKG